MMIDVTNAAIDCERFLAGWLGQPANAITSLSFGVVGIWILARAGRHGAHGRTVDLTVFAVAVMANTIGGLAYHGFRPWWGHWAHDVAILSVLSFILVHDASLVWGWAPRARLLGYGAILLAIGIVLAIVPRSTDLLSLVVGTGAGLGEVAAWRKGYRPRPSDGWTPRTAAWLVVVVALILGVLLGRTASPLCYPQSLVQFHGLWHLLQAVVMGTYAYAAIELWSPSVQLRGETPRSGGVDVR